jgi:hypothetical protein
MRNGLKVMQMEALYIGLMWDTIPPSAWKDWEKKREKPVRKASVLTAMLCSFVEKCMRSNRSLFTAEWPRSLCALVVFARKLLHNPDLFIGRISAAWRNRSLHYAKAARGWPCTPHPSACRVWWPLELVNAGQTAPCSNPSGHCVSSC